MNKNPVGRPRKFGSPKQLETTINEYFENTPQNEYSVTGLALVIGSKQLIQDYEKREGYEEIIARAKLLVENSYELSLRKYGRSGDIFALKNFGWKDKFEHDVELKGCAYTLPLKQAVEAHAVETE